MAMFDQYPTKSTRITSLAATNQTIASGPVHINGIVIRAATSCTLVTFRNIDDTVLFQMDVTAGETTYWDIKASFTDLEVIADAGTASEVTVFHL
jgi:hypothetical protein